MRERLKKSEEWSEGERVKESVGVSEEERWRE